MGKATAAWLGTGRRQGEEIAGDSLYVQAERRMTGVGKGGLKNSPLDGKPEPARKLRPTAEQRHFQEYRDF